MAEIGHAYLTIIPTFGGSGKLTKSIEGMMGGAYAKTSEISSKAGSQAASRFGGGFLKSGAIVGAAASVTSKAIGLISSSIGGAVSRVDQMNNFPRVMQNLGYSSEDASKSIQIMSDRLQGLPTSLDSMTGMVQQIAPVTGSLKTATDISLAFNDALLAGGKSTELQGYAMEQYSRILSTGKVDLQAWRSIQTAMPGQLDQVAKALLGPTKNSMDLYQALQSGNVSMDDFNNTLVRLDSEGANGFASFSQQAKDATGGIGTAFANVKTAVVRAIGNIIQAIGSSTIAGAVNSITNLVNGASNIIVSAIGFVKDHISVISPIVAGVVGAFATLAAKSVVLTSFANLAPGAASLGNALNSVKGAVGFFATRLNTLGSAVTLSGGGIKGFTAVLRGGLGSALGALVSPVGIIVAGVAALAAAFVYLMTTNEGFRNTIMGIVSDLGTQLAPVIDALVPMLSNVAASLMPSIIGAISQLLPVLGQIIVVIAQIITAVAPILAMLISTVVPVIAQILALIVQVAAQIIIAVMPMISSILSAIQTAMPAIQAIITTAMSVIRGIIQTVWPIIQAVITTVMGAIQSVIQIVTGIISGDWGQVWDGIKSLFVGIWNGILAIAQSVLSAISAAISGALNFISGIWNGAWNALSAYLRAAWEGIKNGIANGIESVMGFLGGLPGRIMGFFAGAGTWLIQAGANILHGLWDGISGALGWLGNQLGSIGQFILDHKGPKAYDLALLVPAGKWIMRGLGTGIENSLPALRRTLSGVAREVSGFSAEAGPISLTTPVTRYRVEGALKGINNTTNNYSFGDINFSLKDFEDIQTMEDMLTIMNRKWRAL